MLFEQTVFHRRLAIVFGSKQSPVVLKIRKLREKMVRFYNVKAVFKCHTFIPQLLIALTEKQYTRVNCKSFLDPWTRMYQIKFYTNLVKIYNV